MTATTRAAECNAPGTTLMLALDLGSTKWTLGFTTAGAGTRPVALACKPRARGQRGVRAEPFEAEGLPPADLWDAAPPLG